MQEPTLEHWYLALGSPHGIIINCIGCDPEKVRQRLYTIRKAAGDPDLEILTIATSPSEPTQLWIYRRTKNETQS